MLVGDMTYRADMSCRQQHASSSLYLCGMVF